MPTQRCWLIALAVALALLLVVAGGILLLWHSSASPASNSAASTSAPSLSSSTSALPSSNDANAQKPPGTNLASSSRSQARTVGLPAYDFSSSNGPRAEVYAAGAFVSEKTVDWEWSAPFYNLNSPNGWPAYNAVQIWCWKAKMTCDIAEAFMATTTDADPSQDLSAGLLSLAIKSWSSTTVIAFGSGGGRGAIPTCIADCGYEDYYLAVDLKNKTLRLTEMDSWDGPSTDTFLLVGSGYVDPTYGEFPDWPKEPILGEYHTPCSGGAPIPGPILPGGSCATAK